MTVREVDTDRTGRTVAEVILPDRTNLNREMVERPMARYYREYAPGDVVLNRAEVCAKVAKTRPMETVKPGHAVGMA